MTRMFMVPSVLVAAVKPVPVALQLRLVRCAMIFVSSAGSEPLAPLGQRKIESDQTRADRAYKDVALGGIQTVCMQNTRLVELVLDAPCHACTARCARDAPPYCECDIDVRTFLRLSNEKFNGVGVKFKFLITRVT